ncbi:Peptidase M30, hyicolysin [Gemmatirosa kalamazoonensis]|uniref:Peptidase M30, hyicolysin n=1 Tax=Gemmatirosa kalamazoonensis TaxID=861299 RepID=W0RGU4_9BACT|nr:hypothetical protein [Gemmatirosa kalamazoonensis]AHG90001.1 Peptidase M30, hyicolysin [Gemmatirosa kalamazoonensis]
MTIARPAPFTVTRIPTDTLKASANLTLTGDGFAPGAMSASIAGFPASILDVTSTRLLIAVPSASGLPCAPPSVARIVVRRTSGGVVDSVVGEAPLDPATPRILAIGQRAVLARPDELRCTRLEHGGEFVVSIYDASTTAPGGVAAQLRGRSMGGTIAVRAPVAVRAAAAAPRVQPDPVALAHAVHLARERTRLRALGARAVAPPPRRPLGARAVAVPAVGDVVTLNAMYFDCAAPTPVRARVAAVGAHSLVVEDTAAAGAGSRDALYRDLADEFDRVMLPIVTTYFGDPLALDAKFGGDGRVRILFTPYVTDSVPNTFGFMTGCNFVPKTQLASSNEAAVFYARLPLGVETATEWRRQLRATLVHETKHLAAYAERFARAGAGQPVLEETWLEEATARVAEELYARTFSGATWKGNAAFAPTVGCELTSCDGRPIAMLKHFSALGDYYARVDSLTPLGPVSRFDGSFYGSGWLLVRWAADNFASDEAAFFRALTTETAVTGIQNLVRRTVRAPYDMLPDWSLALAVDDRPGFTPRDATLTIPSWNTRDVFRGLSAANPIGFPRPFPLLERTASFGDFVVDVPLLRSYTSAFVELSGPVGTKQLLSLQAPTDVGLAIVRVR